MTKSAHQKRHEQENKASGLVIISGGLRRRKSDTEIEVIPTIRQSRLADICELSARIEYDTVMLKQKRNQLRHELSNGGRVERGPLRAYFDQSFVVTKTGKKFQRARLIVR